MFGKIIAKIIYINYHVYEVFFFSLSLSLFQMTNLLYIVVQGANAICLM